MVQTAVLWMNVYHGFPAEEDEQEVLPIYLFGSWKNASYAADGVYLVQKNLNLSSRIDFRPAF